MDISDVSEVPQYIQLLQQQRKTLRDAQSRKGQRPKGRKSRDELQLQFMFRHILKREKPEFGLRTTFLPPAYGPCTKALRDLKKIMIDDLVLETHHRGNYLVLRSITPPDRLNAIMAVVEDENNDALILQLYHQEDEGGRSAEEILREGTVIIVKEPYLKLMSDGEYGIRVDHLSDTILLLEGDDRIPICWQSRFIEVDIPAEKLKERGNEAFNKSSYYDAVKYYTNALSSSPTAEEAISIKLNRSLAYIRRGQFESALSDLDGVLESSNASEKGLYRKAQALYYLQRYRECCEVVNGLRRAFPNNKEASSLLTRSIERLVEQEKGKYKFKQMYSEAAKLRPPLLDHSTFVGPVSIQTAASKGRGLFTTKAVKAGDLLLCEKAFAHSFIDQENRSPNSKMTLLIHTDSDSLYMGGRADLIETMLQKLHRNPSMIPVITDLHHGKYPTSDIFEVDGTAILDTFLVDQITSLNCFGCPLSTRQHYLSNTKDASPQRSQESAAFHSCGIWPMASYINHSCYSNCRRAFIGDMMFVYATQDLAADTEIAFWYQIPTGTNFNERKKKLANWNFTCECVICQDERATDQATLAKRKRLRTQSTAYLKSRNRANITKLETAIANLKATYSRPAADVPHLAIWDMQLYLSQIYMESRKVTKAIDLGLGMLESLGYVIDGGRVPRTSNALITIRKWGLMVESVIKCWVILGDAYEIVAPDLQIQAEQYAKLSYKVCVGEDETFEETYQYFC
ncbi:TPR domain protein [Xylogone sp. PMI_703]|nr:TPR domain protein [Xylogone sp. PMI_703]